MDRLGLGGTTRWTWMSSGGSGGTENVRYIRRCSFKISESSVCKLNWKGGELREWSGRRHMDLYIEFRVIVWIQRRS